MLLLIAMLGGWSLDIVPFFELLFIGYVLGEIFDLNISVERTVVYTCALALAVGIVVLFFYSILSATGFKTLISDYILKNIELSFELYKRMGIIPADVELEPEALEKIYYYFVRILPSLVIASTLFLIWTSLLLARPILVSRHLRYPEFGPLNLWKAPEYRRALRLPGCPPPNPA